MKWAHYFFYNNILGWQDIGLANPLPFCINQYNRNNNEEILCAVDTCNNINSLYIVKERFHDTYVLEGDVYMDKNVLLSEVSQSTYFARKKKYENEWGLEVDNSNRLVKINIGAGEGFLMSGISYWKKEDCQKIISHMEEVYATKDYTNLYWDNMVLDIYPELDIHVREIEGIYEIDTLEELKEVENKLSQNHERN